jgi:hypothetical protein
MPVKLAAVLTVTPDTKNYISSIYRLWLNLQCLTYQHHNTLILRCQLLIDFVELMGVKIMEFYKIKTPNKLIVSIPMIRKEFILR